MVDSDAAVAWAFEGFLGEPVMFVMLCERFFQGSAEDLQLLLADAAPCPEEAGDEAHGGCDLREGVLPAEAAAAAAAEGAPVPALGLAHDAADAAAAAFLDLGRL